MLWDRFPYLLERMWAEKSSCYSLLKVRFERSALPGNRIPNQHDLIHVIGQDGEDWLLDRVNIGFNFLWFFVCIVLVKKSCRSLVNFWAKLECKYLPIESFHCQPIITTEIIEGTWNHNFATEILRLSNQVLLEVLTEMRIACNSSVRHSSMNWEVVVILLHFFEILTASSYEFNSGNLFNFCWLGCFIAFCLLLGCFPFSK